MKRDLNFLLNYNGVKIFETQTKLVEYLNRDQQENNSKFKQSYISLIINGKRLFKEEYKNAFKNALERLQDDQLIDENIITQLKGELDRAYEDREKIFFENTNKRSEFPLKLATSYSEYAIPIFRLFEDYKKENEVQLELCSFLNEMTGECTQEDEEGSKPLTAPLIFEMLKTERIHGAFLINDAFQENIKEEQYVGSPFSPIARISISNGKIPVLIARKGHCEKFIDNGNNSMLDWINNIVFKDVEFPILYIQGTVSEVIFDKFFQDNQYFNRQIPICIRENEKLEFDQYVNDYEGFILIGWDNYIQEINNTLVANNSFESIFIYNLKEFKPFIKRHYLQSFDLIINNNYFAGYFATIKTMLEKLQRISTELSSRKMNKQLEIYVGNLIKHNESEQKQTALDRFYDNFKFEILIYLKYQELLIKGINSNEIKLK